MTTPHDLSKHIFKKIHFVGIGGIGMSGIAEVLTNLGYSVQGSDVSESANVERLRKIGIPIEIGHKASNIAGAQVIVTSTAVKADNPEVIAARTARIPIIKRAEMLAELMRLKLSVAISGTHGKTTTTSLAAALLDAANLDPTVVNGGIINSYDTNARLGAGEWIVVEADESDGSFLRLPATIAVVTNIDPEHMDFYKDFETLKQAFVSFIERIPFYGLGILCVDHPEVKALLPKVIDRRIVTYGFSEDANIRATNLRDTPQGIHFDVEVVTNTALEHRGRVQLLPQRIKDIFLPMMGRHNVQNALSVVAIALELGLGEEIIRAAFANFKGVKRRFTKTGTSHGISVIDDYAHHPVEIKTVLSAARQACSGKVVVVAQPHRFSRLQHLFDDFAACFDEVDALVLTPVYSAGETREENGPTSETLAQAIRARGKTVYTVDYDSEIAPLVAKLVTPDKTPADIVVCMGAGSITYWAAVLPQQLDEYLEDSKICQQA